jgi:LDH2 family malate/lactate/ureidoglycolate dehydrogenase
MKTIHAENLKNLCTRMFMAAGTPHEEAEIVVDNLVRASLRGVDSHGVRAIPRYIQNITEGKIVPDAPIVVIKDTLTTAMWDNNRGFGFVAGKKAMETAMRKADTYGVGAVGTYNPKEGDDHIGALYYYAEMAALQDMIGIVTCSCSPNMAAWGGAARVIGVNPIAIAVPAGTHPPIVWDIATSQVAVGHLSVMAMRGEAIPEGWLLDKDGQPTTDPKAYFDGGALLPFGTYKGYGLAIIIDAITGGLGAGCSFDNQRYGHLFMAIDPSGFTPLQDFKSRVDRLIGYIKASPRRPGVQEVFVPGEIEQRTMERRLKNGIPLDDPDWNALAKTATAQGIDVEDFAD